MTAVLETPPTEVEDLSIDLVRESTSPLGKYLSQGGVKYASKTINVYTDIAAQLVIDEVSATIERRLDEMSKEALGGITGYDEETDEKLIELRGKLAAAKEAKWHTRLEVTVQTVPQKLLDVITKSMASKKKRYGWDDEKHSEIWAKHFYRNAIKSVKVIETGLEITDTLSLDEFDDFMSSLPNTQAAKITQTADLLTSAIYMADDKIDAGFPGGSSDVAGEL
jgi:ribonuclease HI